MDFHLTEEQQLLKETVRRFVDNELIPLESQSGAERGVMSEPVLRRLQEKTKALGLWMLDVPEEYGGAGLDLFTRCIITEEVFRSTALPFRDARLFGPEARAVLFHCTPEQKERFLFPVLRDEKLICFAQTEPDAGSDPASMRTSAVPDGDDYVLNGTKRWITGADVSDYAQVMAVTDPAKRARGGITCFIVDLKSPGIQIDKQAPVINGETTFEIVLTDVRVPKANIIGEVGDGFNLAQQWITQGRIQRHGSRQLGIAARAIDMMIDYAKVRVTFGKPLSERQAIQFMIADSVMELRAAELMVYDCAWRFDKGEDVRDLSYMVKITATEMASRVVDRAIQVHGAMGLSTELPLEWWYRQLRTIRITEGVTEVLRWRLGANLIRAKS